MATSTDLWGALDTKELIQRTPLSILREQAALLGEKTGNLVEAQVEKGTYGTDFLLTLNLVVPGLDDYTYELLKVRYPVSLYPVKDQSTYKEIKDEDAFVEWLRVKLSSPETHKIIGNLLSQASS
jgi:hypothetical protein